LARNFLKRPTVVHTADGANLTVDEELLAAIQPQGGITFNHPRYIIAGDGYEACVDVYAYPKHLDTHWLAPVMNLSDVIATLDISTEDMNVVKKNINRSMQEQSVRFNTAKKQSDAADAKERWNELERLYEEVSSMGDVVKLIRLRLFVYAKTLANLEKQIEKYINHLEGNGYKASVFLYEGQSEWQSIYKSYRQQAEGIYKRYGQPIVSQALAGGDPLYYTNLSDPCGIYYGETPSFGSVLWDSFHNDGQLRISYNGVIMGNMGAGKSTFLKKMVLERAIRGDFIRGFDVTGEFAPLVEELGGKIIALDGSSGKLNALEILKTSEEESVCFARHLSKLNTVYKFLIPNGDPHEAIVFDELIREFYITWGLISEGFAGEKQITGLPPEAYPTWSDLLSYINQRMEDARMSENALRAETEVTTMRRLHNIQLVISNLVKSYGYIFDGHTSIENIMNTQIVFFNIKNLSQMKSEIFDVQIFSALLLCWDNCLHIGAKMKDLNDSHGIRWEDIVHSLIFIDEAHKIVNTNKLTALEQLLTIEREGRKYFSGLWLASQSIRDYIPEGSDADSIDKIKTLFELAQYKVIFQQDTLTTEMLNAAFKHQLTQTEIERVPRLTKGHCILVISGKKNIEFGVYINDREKELFRGGV